MYIIDEVLKINFSEELLNEALRSPNHKTCFSFALGCIQNFNFPIQFCRFSPVSTWFQVNPAIPKLPDKVKVLWAS